MSHSVKLLIPIGLGIVAAGINWFALNSATRPVEFVEVTAELKEGTEFSLENLGSVELPARFRDLKDTAYPYEQVGVLLGRRATRSYEKGDIVFRRDLADEGPLSDLPPDEEVHPVSLEGVDIVPAFMVVGGKISFKFQSSDPGNPAEWVGPFPLKNVGSRVTNDPYHDESGGLDRNQDVSVILKKPSSPGRTPMHDRLEEFCDKRATGEVTLLRIKYHSPQEEAATD